MFNGFKKQYNTIANTTLLNNNNNNNSKKDTTSTTVIMSIHVLSTLHVHTYVYVMLCFIAGDIQSIYIHVCIVYYTTEFYKLREFLGNQKCLNIGLFEVRRCFTLHATPSSIY